MCRVYFFSSVLLFQCDHQRNVGIESLDVIVTESVPKCKKSHPKFVVSGSQLGSL